MVRPLIVIIYFCCSARFLTSVCHGSGANVDLALSSAIFFIYICCLVILFHVSFFSCILRF